MSPLKQGANCLFQTLVVMQHPQAKKPQRWEDFLQVNGCENLVRNRC